MTLRITIDNDKELRDFIKNSIMQQVKSVAREEITDLVREEIRKKLTPASLERIAQNEINRVVSYFSAKESMDRVTQARIGPEIEKHMGRLDEEKVTELVVAKIADAMTIKIEKLTSAVLKKK